MDQSFMKEKPIFPLVLKMALPMVISMLVNSLYNIVDSFFVAQVSEDAMTAISIVYPLQNLANAVGVGFGVGINAAVAYYLGAGNGKAANRSIILSALHGIVLAGICVLLIRPFISMFTDSEEIIAYGLDYFYVVIAFAPVLTLGMAFEKVLQATGKMKTTMFCMAIGAVANIILDPIFISGLGAVPAMGVFGAALATGIGQTLSLISYIAVFLLAKIPVRLRLERRGEEKICRKLYFVGIPASLNLALPSFMITVLNAILAAFAEVYVLILGIYYKLQTFIYFTISGIVQGIRPLMSYNLGAGRKDRVLGIFKVTLLLSLGVMIIGTILCLAVPKQLMDIFTDTPQTVEQGAIALRIISAGFIVSAISVVISGTFEALGKGMPSLIISLLRYIAILPIAFLMSYLFQAVGVWHSFWITELISAIVSCVLFWFCFAKRSLSNIKQNIKSS